VPADSVADFRGSLRDFLENYQVFTMSKGNTKAENIIKTLSTESILIIEEFNWIQILAFATPSSLDRCHAHVFTPAVEFRLCFDRGWNGGFVKPRGPGEMVAAPSRRTLTQR